MERVQAPMVIDLGERRDEAVTGRSRPRGRGRRSAVAIGVVAVALLATSGASGPARPVFVEKTITATPGGHVQVLGDLVLLLHDRQWAKPLTMEAYRIADGELAWRSSLPDVGEVGPVGSASGVLMITILDDAHRALTVAVRSTTGRELWRRPGSWFAAGSDQVLLKREGDEPGRQTIEAVAVDSGLVRWSLPPSSADEVVSVVGDRLVCWSPSGRVEVRDLGTGRVLAAATFPAPDLREGQPLIQATGRLLLVSGRVAGHPVVTAYGLDRLDRRWQAPMDLSGEYVSGECGDVLCVVRIEGGARLMDAATGRTRWSDPRWGRLRRAGPHLVAEGVAPPAASGLTPVSILEAETGDVVADLGLWTVTWLSDDGRMAAVRHEPGTSRAVIALLDAAAARARIATVAGDVATCEPAEVVVTCRRLDGSISVWRPPVR